MTREEAYIGGQKLQTYKDLDIKVEDKDSDEQLEKFMKVNENSKLYKAHRALLGSVASDPTFYSGGTGLSPVGGDGFSERFPLSLLYWYQGLRRVRIPCGNGTV